MGCCVSRSEEVASSLHPVAEKVAWNLFAPNVEGQDEKSGKHPEECPICMMYFPALNSHACCGQKICTKCLRKVRSLGSYRKEWVCPFCMFRGPKVTYNGPLSEEELRRQSEERRKTNEALARAKEKESFDISYRNIEEASLDAARYVDDGGVENEADSENLGQQGSEREDSLRARDSEFGDIASAVEAFEAYLRSATDDTRFGHTLGHISPDGHLLEQLLVEQAIRQSLGVPAS
uniref:RING-type domain-containing protein n=1 Tax=Rhodosorus marinus TaxID=101924 RepID=A0A7S0BC56_9RHOD|mmetsp:Transcript_10120/g.14617  ORF Transcript_10120/g.14617 Transcript_10120/m.14617 type:complete len:235 (+) Transcript_10120:374-1078(+)